MANPPQVSEAHICSQALTWCGQDPINTLEEKNEPARWMKANYYLIRDATLEARLWSFAKQRHKSVVATRDPWGIKFQHTIPASWVKVFNAFCDVSPSDPKNWVVSHDWQRLGPYVLSDDATLYLEGVNREVDTGRYSALFVQALTARLAAAAAIPLAGSRQLQEDMWDIYSGIISEASFSDSQQGVREKLRGGNLVKSRRGG